MPDPLPLALILATLAGATIPLGAALAMWSVLPRWHQEEWRHSVVAFGGGALLSAIALVLIPEGSARLTPPWVLVMFAAGGGVFFLIDRSLARRGGHAAQFLAMMLDYLPEALALGALLADDSGLALLLAGLIALQNLPEGFNACREMQHDRPRFNPRLLALFAAMVPIGPAAAWLGLSVLANPDHAPILGGIMVFSAGGILYLIFQDVAPQVPLERHWGPSLGAVAGFLLGLAGHLYAT